MSLICQVKMEESGKDEDQDGETSNVTNKNKDHQCCNNPDPSLFVGDILALTLIASMTALENVNVEKSIRKERNRILKEKAGLEVLLNQLMFDLEEEVNNKLFEQVPESEKKVEEIKLEIEQSEIKICSLGEYANKLDRALKLLKEKSCAQDDESNDNEGKIPEKKKSNNIVRTVATSTPSPSSSSSSSSCISDKRSRVREWRKVAGNKQDVSTWKIITPAIIKSRQRLDQLTNQLNLEFCRQMNSGRSPTRAVLLKIKTLEEGVEECEEEIKAEEERAVNIYKSAIISKDTTIRLRMCTKGKL